MDVGGLSASLKAPIAVFRNPDLRRLELSWAAMSFATWAFTIAVYVYAFDVGGAGAVGLVAVARILPGAVVAPFAGLIADAHSRRGVLLACAAVTALTIAAAAVIAIADAPAAFVFVITAVFAIASSGYPPVESALLPVLARTPQELSAANVAMTVMDNAGFLAGAIGSGLLLAIGGPSLAFGLAAAAAAASALTLFGLSRDERPEYVEAPTLGRLIEQTTAGARTLLAHSGLRLMGVTLTLLLFFEGMADVLIVVVALDLLGLAESSVGYLNAAWGTGALLAGAVLAVMIHRSQLALGIGIGSLVIGMGAALVAGWPTPGAAYVTLAAFGIGYTFVEVASKTFLQRLGTDEQLARVFGFLETSRLTAMAMGSIAAPLLVALVGTRGALLVAGALLPAFALARWVALKAFETGAPVDRERFALLRENAIFKPLPVDTLERLCNDLQPLDVAQGAEVVTQGDAGERFYLIGAGEVEILIDGRAQQTQSRGGSFGEIALIRDVPRAATVRATCATSLLTLEREQFIGAVTGQARSRQVTDAVIDDHLGNGAPR
jgi:MFS family permease